MQYMPIKSSSIKAIGYDEETKMMDIVFNSGAIYRYMNIEKQLLFSFLKAPSVGKFYTSFIKGLPNTRIQ